MFEKQKQSSLLWMNLKKSQFSLFEQPGDWWRPFFFGKILETSILRRTQISEKLLFTIDDAEEASIKKENSADCNDERRLLAGKVNERSREEAISN